MAELSKAAILARGRSNRVAFSRLEKALAAPDTHLRLFGKPGVSGERRMGVALARGENVAAARAAARQAARSVRIDCPGNAGA